MAFLEGNAKIFLAFMVGVVMFVIAVSIYFTVTTPAGQQGLAGIGQSIMSAIASPFISIGNGIASLFSSLFSGIGNALSHLF